MATTLETPARYRLATHAALWATPIVSFDAMRQAFFRDAGAIYGDIVYLSRSADWGFQVTTPVASTRYVYLNFNTKDGPIVIDVPRATGAGLFGSILDAWQVPLADVGPHGLDGGNGGRYLLLPPGYQGAVPPHYIPIRACTYNGYALFRALSYGSSRAAVDRALALVERLRSYPLARAAEAPSGRHIDVSGRVFDGIMRYDDRFYQSLARMLDEEPTLQHDASMTLILRSLGLEKARAFAPDVALRRELQSAAKETLVQLVEGASQEGSPFWPNALWRQTSGLGARTGFTFVDDEGLHATERAQTFFMTCAPPKALGQVSVDLGAYCDGDGRPLSGAGSYRLHLPANVPVEQFWALTVYDAVTCAFLRPSPKVEVSSYHDGLQVNRDGSVDIFLDDRPPTGLQANWIALSPERPWFALLRFYGPRPAFFDKKWQAPDIERVS